MQIPDLQISSAAQEAQARVPPQPSLKVPQSLDVPF
jgi:hypothetical protein